jgi:phosphoribosylaminoimidazolecarboxamide formyltransferase/IMP cyclohydrolase
MTRIPVKRALISVSEKTDLVPFVRRLVAAGVEIVSSAGTALMLREAHLPVVEIAKVTGAPEILGGRVKTLHPKIHGAILADRANPSHSADLEMHGIEPFQLVVVNLYPFEATVAGGATLADALEHIDIGGPAMIRAAAKNHRSVGVIVSPDQYDEVATAVEAGGLDDQLRTKLAMRAFFRTAAYDAAIVDYLAGDGFPDYLVLPLERVGSLRYGENPHQKAAAYTDGTGWWTQARFVQGKELSFNNLVDAESAWRLVNDLGTPAAVVVKHTNACGAAERATLVEAFTAAWDCDPLSAFGGVVAVNVPLDAETAAAVAERFVEVLVAPLLEEGAAEALSARPALRVLEAPLPGAEDLDLRRLEGGLLVQVRDRPDDDVGAWTHVAGPRPAEETLADLRFAWVVAAYTKSNAIVVARRRAAVGVGAGDQSRVGAAERAVARAGDRAKGGVAASDAFFPFRDGLDTLADAGVIAVVEPGGSQRDEEVMTAADERGVALMFTGKRHFKH